MSYKTEKLKLKLKRMLPQFFGMLLIITLLTAFLTIISCKPTVKKEPKYEEKIVSNLVQQQPAFMNPPDYLVCFTDGTSVHVSIETYAKCAIGDTVYLPINE